MASLYIFGDSFSQTFHDDVLWVDNYVNWKKYRPLSYSEILANKLNLDLKNYTTFKNQKYVGNCNESIFNNFCLSTPEMEKGDIVIFQYTVIERIKWSCDSQLQSILPNNNPPSLNKDEIFAIEQIMINKSNDVWYKNYIPKEILMNNFANDRGIKVFYWSHDEKFYSVNQEHIKNENSWLITNKIYQNDDMKKLTNILRSHGGLTIAQETNNEINDSHFSESAHKLLAEYFYEDIIKKSV